MKLLKKISNEDIGFVRKKVLYFVRIAARAILFGGKVYCSERSGIFKKSSGNEK